MTCRIAAILSLVTAVAVWLGPGPATAANAAPADASEKAGPAPVVVELFTSQGCSSCPPADALMAEIADEPGIIAISWAVDYWNYLGWKDTLSRHAFTERQKAYMTTFDTRFVYTPQMIVNGRREMVGSKEKKVRAAIEEARKDGPFVPLSVEKRDGHYILKVGPGETQEPATVWLVHTLSKKEVAIGGGENEGRVITYTDVARSIHKIGTWTGAPRTFKMTKSEDTSAESDGCTILLQQDGAGPVLGALEVPQTLLTAER